MTQVETPSLDDIRSQAGGAARSASVESEALVMIVDDEPLNVIVARKFLQRAGYERFVEQTDATQAVSCFYAETPDVLLLDLMMPVVSGLEILAAIRDDPQFSTTPIIVLTASTDAETRSKALNLGATDFLAKPVDSVELIPRVRNALLVKRHQDRLERLVEERTEELERSRREVIHCLARAAEFRDCETGRHTLRVGRYAGIIARQYGLDEERAGMIELAATLHDLGKIGIPDEILRKPGKLTPEEYEAMKRHSGFGEQIVGPIDDEEHNEFSNHAEIGSAIMGDCRSPILKVASKIACTHHEKFDGSGYPAGLAGRAIPIEGRITAVADVFDALSTQRPYKPAFPLEKCLDMLEEGRGGHFDPEVLDAFFAGKEEILQAQRELAD